MRTLSLATWRHLVLALLIGGLALWPAGAQVTPKKDLAKTPAFKLPSGAIIIVTKDLDAIEKPDAYYLTPEKYKEMSDQIESLKKQIGAEKAMPPSSCELDGRLETRGSQTIVKLKATFRFRTTVRHSVVFLGCQKSQPVDAKLEDGKLPLLAATDKGLTVHVDSIGEHTLRIDLELPLLPRGKGNEIGFEIGLPGAPITTLTFGAPAKAKRLTIIRREISNTPPTGTDSPLDLKRYDADKPLPALGAITNLGVSWEDSGQMGVAAAARTADADVQVTIGETDIQAEARIRLKGSEKEWRFLAPYNAEVAVGRAPPASGAGKPIDFPIDQAPDIVRPEPGKSEWRIRFRESNSTELLVVVTARTTRNRGPDLKGRTVWAVGPFAALDVVQQTGTVHIKSLPHIRAVATPKGDTQRIDNSDDPNAEAIYRYRSLPTGPKDYVGAPLELDIRAAAGIVQTRVHHHLALGEGGWRLRSEITVTPIRTEVETLDVEVPVPGVFEASTPKLVEGIVPVRDNGPQRRIVQIKLAAPQRAEFSLTLEGFYPLLATAQETMLVLPRLLNVFDRGGQVTVAVPDGFDLRGGAYQWEGDKPGNRLHPFDPPVVTDRATSLSATVRRTMSHVDLAWKPIRADVRVESSVDVILGDRQAQVTQQLRYMFADRSLRKLRLRGPVSIAGITATPGSVEINAPGDWFVNLPADPGKDGTIVVSYTFPMPANSSHLTVPLIWPEAVTSCENRVRILRDRAAVQHLLPTLDVGLWQETPTEFVTGETSFPLLALRASGLNLPLTLSLQDAEASSPSMPLVWIDRILIQAQSSDAGQKYRARFHLQKWLARTLDLELPASAIDAEVRINGLRADVSDTPSEGEAGRVLRIKLFGRESPRLLIELSYTLPLTANDNTWMMRCLPPRPRGRVAIASVRWQVAIPARSLPLSIGDGSFEERWIIRNGFAHPVAAHATSDLEKWIATGQEPDGSEIRAGWQMTDTGVTAQQPTLAPLRIVIVPRIVWLLGVSLGVLVIGLVFSRLPKRTVGVLLSLTAAGLVILGLLWPQPIGQVLAAGQPGLAFLAIVLGLQRFLQWRYRRRLARLPGFTRVHAESALTRSNGKGPSRMTSTIQPTAGN